LLQRREARELTISPEPRRSKLVTSNLNEAAKADELHILQLRKKAVPRIADPNCRLDRSNISVGKIWSNSRERLTVEPSICIDNSHDDI
jgi:hypothetical protein